MQGTVACHLNVLLQSSFLFILFVCRCISREGEKYLDFVDALNAVIKIIEKEPVKTKEQESTTTLKPQL